jgi:hypothetical protein
VSEPLRHLRLGTRRPEPFSDTSRYSTNNRRANQTTDNAMQATVLTRSGRQRLSNCSLLTDAQLPPFSAGDRFTQGILSTWTRDDLDRLGRA